MDEHASGKGDQSLRSGALSISAPSFVNAIIGEVVQTSTRVGFVEGCGRPEVTSAEIGVEWACGGECRPGEWVLDILSLVTFFSRMGSFL